MKKISRGQVWMVNLDPKVGAEMAKLRPCVVISADKIGALPLKVVVPITAWQNEYEGHLWLVKLEPDSQNGLSKTSAADAFQVKSLSIERFERLIGVLTDDQVADIAAAIGIVIQVF